MPGADDQRIARAYLNLCLALPCVTANPAGSCGTRRVGYRLNEGWRDHVIDDM